MKKMILIICVVMIGSILVLTSNSFAAREIGAIIIVEVVIIKSGINRHITIMAGPGVIIPSATTIVRHTV